MEGVESRLSGEFEFGYVPTNGIRLHYAACGPKNAPLMLFAHGFPQFWYTWRNQMKAFQDRFRCVAVDLRGYNLSDKPAERKAYAMTQIAEDLAGVIPALGYEKAVVVAHDWGGAASWLLADRHPERITRFIMVNMPHPALMSAALKGGNFQQLKKSWYIFFFQLPRLPERMLARHGFRGVSGAIKGSLFNKDAISREDLDAFAFAASRPGTLTAMLNYYRNAFSRESLKRRWGKITVPTLLIWGENDQALGKELTYGTERYVNDLEVAYIPDASHWVPEEKPQEVIRLMKDFLKRREA